MPGSFIKQTREQLGLTQELRLIYAYHSAHHEITLIALYFKAD